MSSGTSGIAGLPPRAGERALPRSMKAPRRPSRKSWSTALGYLIDAYGNILYPEYAETFGLVAGVGALIGELPFFLWLAIKGVNVQRYNERSQQPH
jgi:hypothetical protein